MLCGGVRLSPTNQKENYLLKKKDEILFTVSPTANQSATAGTGIVTGVDGDLAACSVFLSPLKKSHSNTSDRNGSFSSRRSYNNKILGYSPNPTSPKMLIFVSEGV